MLRSGRSPSPPSSAAAMPRLPLILAVLLVSGACRAQRSPAPAPVRAERGMVVSAERHASEAGVEVMRGGGNAVDAAVATGFALAVTFPVAGNLGGGGFMVVRFPDGTATTLDYRETAPAAATRDMYVDDSTGAVRPDLSRRGALASGVPGSVAGLLTAHERWGKAPLADVLAPAIRLAEGYPLSAAEADRLNSAAPSFARYPGTARHFTSSPAASPPARRSASPSWRPSCAASATGAATGSTAARPRTWSWPRWSAAAGSSRSKTWPATGPSSARRSSATTAATA